MNDDAVQLPRDSDQARFEAALGRFDGENARDPNTEVADGVSQPRELLYSRRLTGWVLRLKPDAAEPLRLAARCQHLCRWEVPRSSYPMTKAGYLNWRGELKKFHAHKSAEILRALGYPEALVARVQSLNLKRDFPNDPDSRVLEDALCLVFLEFQFAELAAKTDDEKLINALRKTWQKMTEPARQEALQLSFGSRELALVQRALQPS